jgi:hypothetical protein
MKKILLIIFGVIALSVNAYAQRFLEIGAAGGFNFTDGVDRRLTGDFNANIGLTIESGLGLGVFFTGFQTTSKCDSRLEYDFDDCKFCFRGYYGGVYADKMFLRKSFFYLTAGAKLGFGCVNYSNHTVEKEYYNPEDGTRTVSYQKADKSFVMSLEPYAAANFEINDFVTLAAGIEYRNLLFGNLHCSGFHIANGSDLNGIVYLLKVRFMTDF